MIIVVIARGPLKDEDNDQVCLPMDDLLRLLDLEKQDIYFPNKPNFALLREKEEGRRHRMLLNV